MGPDPQTKSVFSWRQVGDFIVEMYSEGEIDATAWSPFIAAFHRNRPRIKGVLVLTKGGAPDPRQRAELRTVLDDGPALPAAILSDSRMTRIAVTALNFFLAPEARPRVFAPHQLDDAFEYLQVPPSLRPECRRALSDMESELGIERIDSA